MPERQNSNILETPIEYLKGVGPVRGEILRKELNIHTCLNLIYYFPFRYIDRSQFFKIKDLQPDQNYVQLKGHVTFIETLGGKWKGQNRLKATFSDETGNIELIWFSGVKWIKNYLQTGAPYVLYGKPNFFRGSISIPHPELEIVTPVSGEQNIKFQPVYNTTEKAKNAGITSKTIYQLIKTLFSLYNGNFQETLPQGIIAPLKLMSRNAALRNIHLPGTLQDAERAEFRLKFEELFIAQLTLLKIHGLRKQKIKSVQLTNIDNYFQAFYDSCLPFQLTNAQKSVLRDIRQDVKSGAQMNRLLQGDVGSGKTIVAVMSMLMAIDNGLQATILAPTEILAFQHFQAINNLLEPLSLNIALLTGSSKSAERKTLLNNLKSGEIHLLIGTHAILESKVQFKNLGMAVIDEQHRFGVAQRAAIWQKQHKLPPHILVMTATPIPRTLAMTLYGDLDVSVIDEMPPGRKPVKTLHRTDANRLRVFEFIREQIRKGRQVYIVYPLIEESQKMDYKDLYDGFESVSRAFKNTPISIMHGQMKAEDKRYEMNRFVKGETKIMVATTVIEVGVDVSNASVMVIESAERFGLSQLHQLRGRIGRGTEQSFCILMSGDKISETAKIRITAMCESGDGFKIAEIDLELRGPGDMAGTKQSGQLIFKIANLATDQQILKVARSGAKKILEEDPQLIHLDNQKLRKIIEKQVTEKIQWAKIS